jgi:diacylglycerol kinase (ATP)
MIDSDNKMNKPFQFSGRIRSFKVAFRGIWTMLLTQHNAWIHLIATIGVVTAGFLLDVSSSEWCWLILAIIVVWSTEALNTALELLADVTSPEFHPLVKKAKDVAAGAVLISAIGAAAIGLIILGPYIIELLK